MEATDTTETLESEPQSGPYVRVRWIAEYFDVAVSTVYALIETGTLPAIAIGTGAKKTLRVHRADFKAYERSLRTTVQPANPSVA
ncbi:helix-turn-helix domain-containing protein [Streptomyces sp. NPDC001584]|uniref:helix-turn-helix domain-containing protein n=1 Tax=Streptomyces sp. NPDC001584 TaxID=3154521 RepID=UPI00332A6D33